MSESLSPGTHTFGPEAGWIRLNTFKEGLLSRMGHDLTLEVGGFALELEIAEGQAGGLKLRLDRASIQVVGPDDLSAKDRREIQKNVQKHLPGDPGFEASWDAEGLSESGSIRGKASLGRGAASVELSFVKEGTSFRGDAEISHAALGLKPFRAPLGVIRLQDRVVLSFSLDLQAAFAEPGA